MHALCWQIGQVCKALVVNGQTGVPQRLGGLKPIPSLGCQRAPDDLSQRSVDFRAQVARVGLAGVRQPEAPSVLEPRRPQAASLQRGVCGGGAYTINAASTDHRIKALTSITGALR